LELKEPITAKCLNKYFRYLKVTKTIIDDTISGEVNNSSLENISYISSGNTTSDIVQISGQKTSANKVRIELMAYMLGKVQIRSWLNLYGEVQEDMVEEVILDDTD
jgi:hypothetical protein